MKTVKHFYEPRYSDAKYYGDLEYIIEDNKVEIAKYVGAPGEVELPDEIEGLDVTEIGSTAFQDKAITIKKFPSKLEFINSDAFKNTLVDGEIELPEGVNFIEEDAFDDGVYFYRDGKKYESVKGYFVTIDDEVKYFEDIDVKIKWCFPFGDEGGG